ncbi:unnamed protein product [Amoebophrya sp. A120]|nr:unnamed protein product [Amoebophrya sp. A120]|eukprot:GSA120T00013091001.1
MSSRRSQTANCKSACYDWEKLAQIWVKALELFLQNGPQKTPENLDESTSQVAYEDEGRHGPNSFIPVELFCRSITTAKLPGVATPPGGFFLFCFARAAGCEK